MWPKSTCKDLAFTALALLPVAVIVTGYVLSRVLARRGHNPRWLLFATFGVLLAIAQILVS